MRTFFLDINSFEMRGMRLPDATYNTRLKTYVYEGEVLPAHLEAYQSRDYSLLRWKEDQYNRKVHPVKLAEHRFTPRPHQKEAAISIARAAKKGYRGFVEGDGTGIGKTLASIYGIHGAMKAKGQKSSKVLIICPLAAVEQWANTLRAFPLAGARICIVNYEQASKLLKEPASAKNVKKKATKKSHLMSKGTPIIDWDYIVADESQKLKNWEISERPKAFGRLAKYYEANNVPFVIWASATIGQTPLELRYLFPLLKQITGDNHSMDWFAWLVKHNFHVHKAEKSGNIIWTQPSKKATLEDIAYIKKRKQADLNRLNKMLFSENSPSIRRTPVDIAGWPEINRIPQGSTLSIKQYVEYQKEWLLFRSDRSLLLKGRNPRGALEKALRFRQKSSLLRLEHTAAHVEDLLDNGYQVAVYCEFIENVDAFKKSLSKYGVAEFTGRNENVREQERLAFQRGECKVIIFSVDSAVSFHADETLPNGRKSTPTPRATVMHDLPYSGIKATQVEGRCHRDGKFAPVYYMYATNTTENRIATRMVDRIKNITTIMDDEEFASQLENLLAGEK